MKMITDDPKGFFESGGWTFLDPGSDEEDANHESAESEEDEVYEPTDIDSDEESDEDSEYSEASEDDDSEESEDLGSDEESGKDWSDLEREAEEEDMNYNKDDYITSKNKKSSHGRDRNKQKSSKRFVEIVNIFNIYLFFL